MPFGRFLVYCLLCLLSCTGKTQPTNRVTIRVASEQKLLEAIEAANRSPTPTTLLLEDGTYTLNVLALRVDVPHFVIRSASGDPQKVLLRGPDEGPGASLHHVFLVSADDVTIADLSLGYCRYHGIQVRGEAPYNVKGLVVRNCRLLNCNEQFLKGSSSEDDPVGATDGLIENCHFEFTSGWAYQYYTGGIDIHKGVNWIARSNTFINLRVPASQPGMSEHAIHFWKRCPTTPQNIRIEFNRIINCDRGIGLGLTPDPSNGHNGGNSCVRENLVYNDGAGPRTDVGIGLENADHVVVQSNLVQVTGYWAPIEYRFPASTNLVFKSNLSNAPIRQRDGAPPAILQHNHVGKQSLHPEEPSKGP